MAEQVTIRHPDLRTSDEDSSPPERQVSREAFDQVWSSRGWVVVEEDVTSNADVSATSPSSPSPTRKVTDRPQA